MNSEKTSRTHLERKHLVGIARSADVKTKISESRKGLRYKVSSYTKEQFNELKDMWVEIGKPSYGRFRTVAISRGYDDKSYQCLVNNFKTNTYPRKMI